MKQKKYLCYEVMKEWEMSGTFDRLGVVLLLVVLRFLFTTQNVRFIYQSNLVTFLAQAAAVQLFSSRRRGFCKAK
jgi:hypothetical protein